MCLWRLRFFNPADLGEWLGEGICCARLLLLCDVLFPLVPSLVTDESEDVEPDPDKVDEETLVLIQPGGAVKKHQCYMLLYMHTHSNSHICA